jgi:hypothetical protein
MAVKLNNRSFEFAEKMINDGKYVVDDRDDWSEHQPSAEQENEYIENHGWKNYALWHLGIDDDADAETKAHYKFPYGDFKKVHRCGLTAAEVRAAQRDYYDIEKAAKQLLEMVDERG